MEQAAVILVLLVLVLALLTVVADRIQVPYPIVLVMGGLALGLVPGLPLVELDPELVFVLFLPPLLYWAATESTIRDLRANARPIALLAFGLVAVTILAVALVVHTLVPGIPWTVALVLGAVVSPTDPIAATAIMRRLGVPRTLRTVVEGESLLNDTAAIIIVRIAVAAAVGQALTWWGAILALVLGAVGGIAIGLAVSAAIGWARRRIDDKPVEIALSLVTAWAAYLAADIVGASGVLSVVSAGLYTSVRSPTLITSAQTRLATLSVWSMVNFLGNATLFVLVGLQLPVVLAGVDDGDADSYVMVGLVVAVTVVAVRMLWMFTVPYLVRLLDRRPSQVTRRSGWRDRVVSGWSGMRGAVTLAAALSLPLTDAAGAELPYRSLVILAAFVTVTVTLVGQGLTLPLLIRRLGIRDDGDEDREELLARRAAVDAALVEIDRLGGAVWAREDTLDRLRGAYDFRRRRFAVRAGDASDDGDQPVEDRSQAYQQVVRSVIGAQRRTLVELRDQGEISSAVMRRVERDLDLEDARLEI